MSYGGVIKLMEIRSHDQVCGILETSSNGTIRGHSSGYTSAMAAHLTDPVLISATLHPIIKVWTAEGEQVTLLLYPDDVRAPVDQLHPALQEVQRELPAGRDCPGLPPNQLQEVRGRRKGKNLWSLRFGREAGMIRFSKSISSRKE